MSASVSDLAKRIIDSSLLVAREQALWLADDAELDDLLYWANRIRRKFKGDEVRACAIVSARTGACPEDCAFCSQSRRSKAEIPKHGFISAETVAEGAQAAHAAGAFAFSTVTSGLGPKSDADMRTLVEYVRTIAQAGCIEAHAGFGVLTDDQARQLKAAGLRCYNHNLETSRRFFGQICSTHTYDQRVATLKALRAAGIRICSGGLFGMGETWEDRVDLALDLRELGSANVPMNFLNRVPGTPLADRPAMAPLEILRAIAVYRFVLPDRDIGVYGGREVNLRDLQAFIFMAGANALMIGNYLTTAGRAAELDVQMIKDLGLRLKA